MASVFVAFERFQRETTYQRARGFLARVTAQYDNLLELQQRHPFSLQPEMLRVAINEEFGDWAQPLAAGDSVVFIPPVAGG